MGRQSYEQDTLTDFKLELSKALFHNPTAWYLRRTWDLPCSIVIFFCQIRTNRAFACNMPLPTHLANHGLWLHVASQLSQVAPLHKQARPPHHTLTTAHLRDLEDQVHFGPGKAHALVPVEIADPVRAVVATVRVACAKREDGQGCDRRAAILLLRQVVGRSCGANNTVETGPGSVADQSGCFNLAM
eukprot:363049-Chlamydomonas_euryale.AAC.34